MNKDTITIIASLIGIVVGIITISNQIYPGQSGILPLTVNDSIFPSTTTGSISVSSSPSDASIYLDESYLNTTPMPIKRVGVGSHTITIKYTGYQDWSQKIFLVAGQTMHISATLIPGRPIPALTSTPMSTPISTPILTPISTPISAPISTPAPTPITQIAVSPDPLSFTLGKLNEGETNHQTFQIFNTAKGTLTWTVSANQPWINLNPKNGTDEGKVRIDIVTKGLSKGSHSGTITIESNGGTKTGTISFNLSS